MSLRKEISYYNMFGGWKGMGILDNVERIMKMMDSELMQSLPKRAQDLYYYFEMCAFRLGTVKQQLKDLGISSSTYYKCRKLLVEKDLVIVLKRRNLRGLFEQNLYSRGSQWHIQQEI
jgi:hypothetical protein